MAIRELLVPTLFSIAAAILLLDLPEFTKPKFFTLSENPKVRNRLAAIGRESEYEKFRIDQLTHSIIAAACVTCVSVVATKNLLTSCLFAGGVGTLAFFMIDRGLSGEVKKYQRRIESEFSSIIEMLTLALSAGETPISALARISERSHGNLSGELKVVVKSVRMGTPFHVALDALGRRVDSVVIRRFVDALITAMLRGAPLIDVLQRHAAEVRLVERNHLMDKAGKAEISMMIPVVFLILPISILFALWPSLTHLNLFAA